MKPKQPSAICSAPNCESAELIKSHIVPEGFARYVRRDEHNLILTKERTRTTPQLGDTDWNILCENHDQKLGVYDEVLIDAAKNFRRLHKNLGSQWILPTIDADHFAKGVLAILWRASLSGRREFATFSLGDFEPVARDILFGLLSFAHSNDIAILVQRYTSKHFDVSRFYTYPVLSPFMGLRACGFGLAGFRFLVKFDPRPLPSDLYKLDAAHTGVVRGLYVEIEKTPDFDGIADLMVADMRRSHARMRKNDT